MSRRNTFDMERQALMSHEEEPVSPEELANRQAELEVLERLAARGWSIADPSANTAGAFVRLLEFSGDQPPYTQALQRLIRRQVLVIVEPPGQRKHALTPLGRSGEDELARLRSLYADPKTLLMGLAKEMGRALALAEGKLDDPEPHLRRAREIQVQMLAAINRL